MPRQVDHDERRAEIIRGVWSLIARSGIEAVTLRRVAAEAGVSVGRIQHYFEGRSDLVRASARALIARAEGLYESQDPAAALRFAVAHVIPDTEPERVGATVWLAHVAASVGDPELAAILAEAKRGQEQEVARLLAATGDRRDGADLCAHARSLVALADGLAARVLVGDLTPDEALAVLDPALDPEAHSGPPRP